MWTVCWIQHVYDDEGVFIGYRDVWDRLKNLDEVVRYLELYNLFDDEDALVFPPNDLEMSGLEFKKRILGGN